MQHLQLRAYPHLEKNVVKGNIYFSYRNPKTGKRVRLKEFYGSLEFAAEYHAAVKGQEFIKPASRAVQGSFNALSLEYLASPKFHNLKPNSKRAYQGVIKAFLADYGHLPYAGMKRHHINQIVAKRVKTPGAANKMLDKISLLLGHALDCGYIETNPAIGVKRFKGNTFHTWSEGEILQFEKFYSIGSKYRAAFALMLFTGQRVGDVCVMTWGQVRGDYIHLKQQKTGAVLQIPMHKELKAALAPLRLDGGVINAAAHTIIKTQNGKPYSIKSFGMKMKSQYLAAGLPEHCVSHGLRKAAATRLADAGCNDREIMAITGHRTHSEVLRYTQAASQRGLADSAMEKIVNIKSQI